MSRSNVSAQLAGSALDNYISYITVMADVSQKSASSIGESMKTIYSRYQNVAAGKFVASQEDMASDDYNAEEWEDLNDIETALSSIGVEIRDAVGTFRDFDDVLADIAENWDNLSSVQKSGVSTSMAGKYCQELSKDSKIAL